MAKKHHHPTMIKRESILIFFFLISIKGYSQTDTFIRSYPDYVKSIYSDSLIKSNRVGGFSLRQDFNALRVYYSFIEHYNEYYLKLEDKLIISLWSKDNETVSGITVYSKDFKTKNGLKVGLRLDKLIAIYPDLELQLSEETDEEYFSLEDFSKDNDLTFIVYVKSDTVEKLGKYVSDDFGPKTSDFSQNGVISRIEIFN